MKRCFYPIPHTFFLILFTFYLIPKSYSQSLPTEFNFDWSKAGLTQTVIYDTIEASDFGFVGDSVTVNDSAWTALAGTLGQIPTCVHFPAGNYVFHSQVFMPNKTVVAGEGSTQTRLLFNFTGDYIDLIRISGNISPTSVFLDTNALRGDTVLLVNASSLVVGDWIYVNDVDTALAFSSWADGYDGQLLQVDSLDGDSLIFLNQPLRRNYTTLNGAYFRKMVMKSNCGLSCLAIINQTPTIVFQRSNLLISYAVNCFVKGVESVNADFGHISTERSAHCDISGNYFHHATAYGGSGQGYGVNLQLGANDYLVNSNNFDHVRHSMMVQSGANGNVFKHNYSTNTFWDQAPSNGAGDIVLHGNYAYANLFEENVVQNLVVDASHGKNGPYNVMLRNRIQTYGIIGANNPASDSTAYIGNEITGSAPFAQYLIYGNGNYQFGNNKQGTATPAGTSNLSLISIYDNADTTFSIGYPNTLNQQTIATVTDRLAGIFTNCMDMTDTITDTTSIPTVLANLYESTISIVNPFQNTIEVQHIENGGNLSLWDSFGKLVITALPLKAGVTASIPTASLAAGFYYAQIVTNSKVMKWKLVKW